MLRRMLSKRKFIESAKRLVHRKSWIKVAMLAPTFAGIYVSSWLVRIDGQLENIPSNQITLSIGSVVALKLLVFAGIFATDKGKQSLPFAKLALAATIGSVLLLFGSNWMVPGEAIPRTVLLMDWFGTLSIFGLWSMFRWVLKSGNEVPPLEEKQTHLEYLRNLRRKMRRDGDPRTGGLVTKLRTIYEHLEQSKETASADRNGILPEIHEQAQELYQSCLALLEHTFELWDTGRGLADKTNRKALAAERETIIGEVQQSVEHLDRTMDELRTAVLRRNQSDRGFDSVGEQARLRDELSMGIETVRAVEERMVRLEEELGMRSRD